ncbi:uncharacterized protein LOC114267940 [Camellia sinensis]|uniref:uncharacterized protein LOC114267940 n=1 Tax=Camellia sinensis TaxID=4442 RepID=UPI00103674BD|nr:uncharacterized protein LOC114267940 [Camellia sinensis]
MLQKIVLNEEKKPKNMLEAFLNDDVDPASQLVARYNGSEESSEIIKWISQIIEDGDSRELPFFRAKTPALVPEDADPIWSVGAKTILSKGTGMKQRIGSIMIKEKINAGIICMTYLPTGEQLADVLTKGLHKKQFDKLTSKLAMEDIFKPA